MSVFLARVVIFLVLILLNKLTFFSCLAPVYKASGLSFHFPLALSNAEWATN
jgi:hypothetical protein